MTLVDFLLARIAEDEHIARAATPGPWAAQFTAGNLVYGDPGVGAFVCNTGRQLGEIAQNLDDAAHIERFNPARVLAECDAKRRIIELHKSGEAWCDRCSGWYGPDPAAECPTIRALALPYADHPDYDPAWSPA